MVCEVGWRCEKAVEVKVAIFGDGCCDCCWLREVRLLMR